MTAFSVPVAAFIITAGIGAYVALHRTVPARERLPLIKWLMTWPLVVILVCTTPCGEALQTILRALSS